MAFRGKQSLKVSINDFYIVHMSIDFRTRGGATAWETRHPPESLFGFHLQSGTGLRLGNTLRREGSRGASGLLYGDL